MKNIGNPIEIKNGTVVALKADLRKREIRITVAVGLSDATLEAGHKIESYPEDMIYDVSLQAKQIEMTLPGMTPKNVDTATGEVLDGDGHFASAFKDTLKDELEKHPIDGTEVSMGGEVLQSMTSLKKKRGR
jgi:hypothetical protein